MSEDTSTEQWLSDVAVDIGVAVDGFAATIDSLRELLVVSATRLDDRETSRASRLLAMLRTFLPEGEFQSWKVRMSELLDTVQGEVEATESVPSDGGHEMLSSPVRLEYAEGPLGEDADPFWRFLSVSFSTLTGPSKAEVVRRSVVISAVAAFEVLIRSIMAAFYAARPQALRDGDPKFSLADLRGLASVGDIEDLAVQRQVDRLMYEGVKGWMDWFDRQMHIDVRVLTEDWTTTKEFFERRNLLVHTGGKASAQYVRTTGRADVVVGEVLALDEEYIDAGLDNLVVLGALLAGASWLKLEKHEWELATSKLYRIADEQAEQRRWSSVERICSWSADRTEMESHRLGMMCLSWYAAKMLGDDSIRDEIHRWDTSALGTWYQAARLSLLDDPEGARSLLLTGLNQGDIQPWEILFAPLFEDLLADSLFLEQLRIMTLGGTGTSEEN